MALRLLKLVNRRVNDTTYYRWRIGELPEDLVQKLGWTEGQELVAEARDGRLVLKAAK